MPAGSNPKSSRSRAARRPEVDGPRREPPRGLLGTARIENAQLDQLEQLGTREARRREQLLERDLRGLVQELQHRVVAHAGSLFRRCARGSKRDAADSSRYSAFSRSPGSGGLTIASTQ